MRPRPIALRRAARQRGFTLVELLVAMAAGVLVAAAAILLSKNAVRLFQEESKISYAQVSVALGMQRLGTDLEHAGRESTRNPKKDTRLCAKSNLVDWPPGMQLLQPVLIEAITGAAVPQQSKDNGLTPERITIAGDLESGENFDMRTYLQGASGVTVVLQPKSRPMYRLAALMQDGDISARLSAIFKQGRVLRIENGTSDYYGVIQGLSISGNPIDTISVQLTSVPEVPLSPASSLACAGRGFLSGRQVHVISRVRYEIRSLQNDPQYGAYVQPKNAVTGDDGRTELVRVELDTNNAEMPGTLELISEYAVDLRFGLTAISQLGTADNPQLLRVPIQDPPNPQVYTIAGPATDAGSSPETIRTVHVRLSTRSRAPDRPTTIAAPAGKPYRFLVSTAKTGEKYARVRTLQREFALVNLRNGGP